MTELMDSGDPESLKDMRRLRLRLTLYSSIIHTGCSRSIQLSTLITWNHRELDVRQNSVAGIFIFANWPKWRTRNSAIEIRIKTCFKTTCVHSFISAQC